MKLTRLLLIAAIGGALAVESAQAGNSGSAQVSPSSQATAQLIITRSPNIGFPTHFNIYIDGVRVTNLGYGMKYEGTVKPGLHLITIKHMPHLDGSYPFSQQWIRVVPGRPNYFTAAWRDGGSRILLEGS